MKTLRIGKHGEARVWFGELPQLVMPPAVVLEREFAATAVGGMVPGLAAIEAFRPRGPHFHTGLLGAMFRPDADGALRIEVSETDAHGEVIPWALAARLDEVRAGLPEEYTDAIFEGVAVGDGCSRLGSGVLRFHLAANGRIGSSRYLFQHLAACVPIILGSPDLDAAVQQVQTFLH